MEVASRYQSQEGLQSWCEPDGPSALPTGPLKMNSVYLCFTAGYSISDGSHSAGKDSCEPPEGVHRKTAASSMGGGSTPSGAYLGMFDFMSGKQRKDSVREEQSDNYCGAPLG